MICATTRLWSQPRPDWQPQFLSDFSQVRRRTSSFININTSMSEEISKQTNVPAVLFNNRWASSFIQVQMYKTGIQTEENTVRRFQTRKEKLTLKYQPLFLFFSPSFFCFNMRTFTRREVQNYRVMQLTLQDINVSSQRLSKVDIWTKRVITPSHYTLISWLSHKEVEVITAITAAKRPPAVQVAPLSVSKDTWRHFHPFSCKLGRVQGVL